jgi:6-phosphofructokinase 1
LNKNGKIYFEDLSNKLIENIDRINIDALVCVGGDGTLKIAQKLYEKGLPIVGIPKTIDNDVLLTDVTFGFNSAVSTATDAIDKLHTTAASHHRVMIIEVMGRNAGWIALEAGIAGGADIILIPEIPYKIEQISKVVERRHKKGKRFSIIVVAEGARPEGGDVTVERMVKNADIPVRLGGISKKLCNDIEDITGLESRFTILGHLQRGGSPTPFDRILGTQFGTKASEAVVEGRFGMMTALQNNEIGLVPIKDAIRELKLINPEGFEVKMAKSIGTSFGV